MPSQLDHWLEQIVLPTAVFFYTFVFSLSIALMAVGSYALGASLFVGTILAIVTNFLVFFLGTPIKFTNRGSGCNCGSESEQRNIPI